MPNHIHGIIILNFVVAIRLRLMVARHHCHNLDLKKYFEKVYEDDLT